ncbi:MAG: hypothetical protein L0I13_02345 [Lactococcus plantarum]|nr:hypothetical protein [Lactococcus plantarum]
MSLSQEQIILDYQTNRRQLEAVEDDIRYLQRQGEQAVDRAIQTIARRLGPQALGEQADYLQRDLRQAKETYDEIVNQEKRRLQHALDENERTYRQNMRDIGG